MTATYDRAVRLPAAQNLATLSAAAEQAEANNARLLLIDYDSSADWQLDPLSAAASLAGRTSSALICPAPRIAGFQPYTMARSLTTLGHLSGGRVAWMIDADADAGRNAEFITVVLKLWASWEVGALVHDKDNAIFSDTSKVHKINHEGEHFRVAGPLNMPQPESPLWIAAPATLSADDPRSALVNLILAQPSELDAAQALADAIAAKGSAAPQILTLEAPEGAQA